MMDGGLLQEFDNKLPVGTEKIPAHFNESRGPTDPELSIVIAIEETGFIVIDGYYWALKKMKNQRLCTPNKLKEE
jgi:hypothetical protein